MIVDFEGGIEKFEVAGLSLELNTTRCNNLSAKRFLGNNHLNITTSSFDVDFTTNTLFTIHALPSFWEFVFEKPENRVICAVNTFNYDEYDATSFIRLASKACQMKQFHFSMGEMDPTRGTFT
jgi:hypothetical protein